MSSREAAGRRSRQTGELKPTDPGAAAAGSPLRHDGEWDAGAAGCGELVLALRTRLARLAPGGVLLLTATDPGAREDLPAWCRLAGHELVLADHPRYWIRRKEP